MATVYRGKGGLASPTSQLLKSIGMTRDDLRRHSEQMRQFLTVEQVNAFAPAPATDRSRSRPSSSPSFSRKRSRPASRASASSRARSPTPRRTPVKAEPVEGTLPPRRLDTMHLVLERKMKEKKESQGSVMQSRDSRRVQWSSVALSSRSSTPQHTSDDPVPMTPHHYRYYRERVVSGVYTNESLSKEATPSVRQTSIARNIYSTPRTPPRVLSQCSSPAPVVNLVSSPGPMRSSPPAQDEESSPFTLPPGPYSDAKPDFAYAGLIGQAILSSPQHRLTLQDIYEWITTVYPHYKRGEQTWMNSVRHCLSTMAVFRKVPRGRSEGKSLWAIFDQDLECFAGGGFRKSLCADMVNDDKLKASKRAAKKRATMDEVVSREKKRRKKAEKPSEAPSIAGPSLPVTHHVSAHVPTPVLPPYFPPFHPGTLHQPYYQAFLAAPLPGEPIFPPLPPSSNYHRVAATNTGSFSQSSSQETDEELSIRGPDTSPILVSSSSSLPSLTPHCSSSSSPPLSSHESLTTIDGPPSPSPAPSSSAIGVADHEVESDDEYAQWLRRSPSLEALAPNATVLNEDCYLKVGESKGKQRARGSGRNHSLLSLSPSLGTGLYAARLQEASQRQASTSSPETSQLPLIPSTPPPRPTTPQHKRRVTSSGVHLSPTRTPISHAGLHMSPSPSLAHYKSNLDPPPAAVYLPQAPLLVIPTEAFKTPPRTPSKRSGSYGASLFSPSPLAPVTPKRYGYASESYYSPWRTPGSQSILDPHDPSVLLDEEISRQNLQNSPGVLGRPQRSLYDSPTGMSPGSWSRYW
ncbi:uncharacterized protein LAESUDRAFT_711911 [Laetiporus sulphureus 93-53]|uniref:Fork-head domain-containing protein n=1 Tax=Laetiporus sulphureus 93-53 TaxID=1314785 RepID=A0A165GBA7_9APHY|nr:uncharacterized protein LAESUDRAFT_711911 [Laetiporus sulphureus 93-53]KZT10104.1 hypothetical protein LAESUDRAFT_711911 [Laetiporus sulphureus 93-53]